MIQMADEILLMLNGTRDGCLFDVQCTAQCTIEADIEVGRRLGVNMAVIEGELYRELQNEGP